MAVRTTCARKAGSDRVASSAENSTLEVYFLACAVMAAVRSSTCSGVIFSLYSMWRGLVARKRWIRGSAASLTASQAVSISFSVERAREATVQSFTWRAMAWTDSKSPGEAMAKPASMTSTLSFSRHSATCNFSLRFMLHPGDCSPSRRVVSKILICFILHLVSSL